MSELVERSGTAAATVRYYLAGGLLPAPRRAQSNRYLYDERHVEILRLIRVLQERRGLSLDEIRSLLPEVLPDLLDAPSGSVFRPEAFSPLISVFPTKSSAAAVAVRLAEEGLTAFSARGFADVSVDEICRGVKIAKGSFYRHFGSKEALFVASVRRIPEHVARAIGSGASIADAVRTNLTAILELASLASQSRTGFSAALAEVLSGLESVVLAGGGAASPSEAHAQVTALLGDAIVGLVAEPEPQVRSSPSVPSRR
jgi:DNA-binding transcriptional MerR regulator